MLATAEDKWVSLHPSFGLICWCDDDKLRKEFQYFDNIKFLYFGQLNDEEKEILQTKFPMFMDKLNIPSISKVSQVTLLSLFFCVHMHIGKILAVSERGGLRCQLGSPISRSRAALVFIVCGLRF